MKISKIIIYDEPTVPEIQIQNIKKFITDTFGIDVKLRKNFFQIANESIFEKIATTRIFDLKKPFQKHIPIFQDIKLEIDSIDMSEKEEKVLYDGFEFNKIITENIPINENSLDTLHIIFTNKLTCTFDENDFRYHARALIGSNPTIISTTGIIEAPAKPKQYYLDLMVNFSEQEIEKIKEKYKGEFLEYHDSRLNEIAEGYLLQAIMYYGMGEAFCDSKECRLFNSHWQKELFYSQIENKKLCGKHLAMINKFKS